MSLFWSTRSMTESREDHLTEFFAAALAHVPSFRAAYGDLVLREFGRRNEWPVPVIVRVETQPAFPGTRCRPDMLLHLGGGRRILCEHKLEAPETHHAEDDRGQLERYLELPVDGLVYVRRGWRPPPEAVLAHARYVSPPERAHFIWSDFYPLLGAGQHVLVDWLREGFEWLGFTPPNPDIGTHSLRPNGEDVRAMLDFAKLWDRVRSCAGRLGWTVGAGSRIQLYLEDHPRSSVSQIFISPESKGQFLVRLTPHEQTQVEFIASALSVVAASLPCQARVRVTTGRKQGQKVKVVDVRATRAGVLGSEKRTVEELEERLLSFVEPLVESVSRGIC